jgi:hypothetical protein
LLCPKQNQTEPNTTLLSVTVAVSHPVEAHVRVAAIVYVIREGALVAAVGCSKAFHLPPARVASTEYGVPPVEGVTTTEMEAVESLVPMLPNTAACAGDCCRTMLEERTLLKLKEVEDAEFGQGAGGSGLGGGGEGLGGRGFKLPLKKSWQPK